MFKARSWGIPKYPSEYTNDLVLLCRATYHRKECRMMVVSEIINSKITSVRDVKECFVLEECHSHEPKDKMVQINE